MKLINWINAKTKFMDKKDFKYECTYIWATILSHFFVVLMSSLIMFIFVGWHLNTFIPELTKEYLPQMVDNEHNNRGIVSVFLIIIDAGLIFSVYLHLLTPEKMVVFEEKCSKWKDSFESKCDNFFKLCNSPIVWVGNTLSICFDFVLSKLCKQIPKE